MIRGLVIYEGPSSIDGAPIVVIATGIDSPARNIKTGPMVQFWIMRQDLPPHEAVKAGLDSAVCGSCPFAGGNGCYVITWQGPLVVWKAYKAGLYRRVSPAKAASIIRGRSRRFGAYGDPLAVPLAIWEPLQAPKLQTGYTRRWIENPDSPARRFLMASVLSEVERDEAESLGWSTYRVRPSGAPRARHEVQCPAPAVTCDRCRACDPSRYKRPRAITEEAHGSAATRAKAEVALG